MSKRASIKDVAQHAGVSYQTVSRVINQKSEVSPGTRIRVLASIAALNYRPSLAAQVFAHERTLIIGVAIPYSADFLSNDHHLLQIVTGIDHVANARNYSLLLSTARSKNEDETSYGRFLSRHIVDGIIAEGGTGQSGAKTLMDRGYPVVMAGYNNLGIPFVKSNDDDGMYNGMQHLIALGHRRIGIISGPVESFKVRNPMQGGLRAMRDAGLSFDDNLMVHGDFTVEGGYQNVGSLMHQPQPPTAIYGANDSTAMGVISWLQEHGYRVPEDISVIGFGDIPSARYFHPPLTTLRQFSNEIGKRAAAMLFDLIDGRELFKTDDFVPAQLMVRGSTAIAPDRR